MLVRLSRFINSFAGRVAIVLALSMMSASILSLLVAERARLSDFNRVRAESIVLAVSDVVSRFGKDPDQTVTMIRDNRLFGVHEAPPDLVTPPPDQVLDRGLTAKLGPAAQAMGATLPHDSCIFQDLSLQAGGAGVRVLADCWYIQFVDAHGIERRLTFDLVPQRSFVQPKSILSPFYLFTLLCASAILAIFVSRVMTAPLRNLAKAARTFSLTHDPEPISEAGPREVRMALQTFNIMQLRVSDGFRERTQLLASIAHDLQTPLTRLRLRLDHVEDDTLRTRLIADLAVMQQLVRDGLDLARSSESSEPWSVVDVDSLLSSVAEDAAEFGSNVRFTGGHGAQVRVKLNALIRCLTNLVDNAIQYAGDAELACRSGGSDLLIEVRDHGSGIPDGAIEEAMKPFSRLGKRSGTDAGGTGLGLTIARAQAMTFGADLVLRNHPDGGLLATIKLKAAS